MNNINTQKTCFFTGHRIISNTAKPTLRSRVKELCIDLIKNKNVTDFICGGALGFDTLTAMTIIELKEEYPSIKLHLYFPCTDQSAKWSFYDKKIWDSIKLLADDYKYITDMPYMAGCMQLRNKAMVNDSNFGIAYCNRTFGGTYSTVKYAQEQGKNIIIISDN